MYKINFTEKNKKICLSLHYNEANSYLSVNGTEFHKFKAKETDIVDFSVDNMKKTGLSGYFYDSSVDDILDINKYLMGKNGIV